MSEPEKYLLLALSLLIGRHRDALLRSLREPLLFRFTEERGAWRASIGERSPELFLSSVLVAEQADFVSPLSALGPHVRLVQTQPGAAPEAKVSAQLAERLGLAPGRDPNLYAVYSPLQVFFTVETGFFLPHRERWYRFAGRCVASRHPGSTLSSERERSRVEWGGGAFEASEQRLAYESAALGFTLELGDEVFDLRASAREASALIRDLRKFCASGVMPQGVRAALEGDSGVRIRC